MLPLLVALIMGAPIAECAGHPDSSMPPRVLLGIHAHPTDAIDIREGRIVIEHDVVKWNVVNPRRLTATWAGSTSEIAEQDVAEGEAWVRSHSVLRKVSVRNGFLHWNEQKVELNNRTFVLEILEAIPWADGILCRFRSTPRKGVFERLFSGEPVLGHEDIEAFSVAYFRTATLRGDVRYVGSKVDRPFFVFPVPRAT